MTFGLRRVYLFPLRLPQHRLGGLSLHTLLGKPSLRTRKTLPAWAMSDGWHLLRRLSHEHSVCRFAWDQRRHNIVPELPQHGEKGSSDSGGPRTRCPRGGRLSTRKPIQRAAPLFAPAQSTARCTRTETRDNQAARQAARSRRSRARKGRGWRKVRALPVASARDAPTGSPGPATRRGGLRGR